MNGISATAVQSSSPVYTSPDQAKAPPIPGEDDSPIGAAVHLGQDLARAGITVNNLVRSSSIAGLVFRNFELFSYISATGSALNGIANAGKGLTERSWTQIKKGAKQLAEGAMTATLAWNIQTIVGFVASNVLNVAQGPYPEVPGKVFTAICGARLITTGLYYRLTGKSKDVSAPLIIGSWLMYKGLYGLDQSTLESNRSQRFGMSFDENQCVNFHNWRGLKA